MPPQPVASTPAVSVALATRNGAAFLEAQLASILAQTRPVDELVVSDDASTDDTVAIAQSIVRSATPHPELRVLRNETPLGVTANFERALRATSGDLVALADQDDVWRPDRIERALARFAADDEVLLVASDARLVDGNGDALGATLLASLGVDGGVVRRLESPQALDELLRRNVLTGATMMVRRSLVERAAPFPRSWVHDEWLAVVAAATGALAVVPAPLIDYRQHGGNQIGVSTLGLRDKLRRLAEPRTARNRRLLARAGDLAERMPQLTHSAAARSSADDKLRHEQVRSALPAARARRVRPVLREVGTGRYGRFGLGAQDILRDLVQPV